jgi:hypothetical protein
MLISIIFLDEGLRLETSDGSRRSSKMEMTIIILSFDLLSVSDRPFSQMFQCQTESWRIIVRKDDETKKTNRRIHERMSQMIWNRNCCFR